MSGKDKGPEPFAKAIPGSLGGFNIRMAGGILSVKWPEDRAEYYCEAINDAFRLAAREIEKAAYERAAKVAEGTDIVVGDVSGQYIARKIRALAEGGNGSNTKDVGEGK